MAGWTYLNVRDDDPGTVVVCFSYAHGGCRDWQWVVDGFVDFVERISARGSRLFERLDGDRSAGRGARFRISTGVCALGMAWISEHHSEKLRRNEVRFRMTGGPSLEQVEAARQWMKARPAAFGLDGPVEAS